MTDYKYYYDLPNELHKESCVYTQDVKQGIHDYKMSRHTLYRDIKYALSEDTIKEKIRAKAPWDLNSPMYNVI